VIKGRSVVGFVCIKRVREQERVINRRDFLTVKHIIINVVSFQAIQFISKYIHNIMTNEER
jgi:hypothetical protein